MKQLPLAHHRVLDLDHPRIMGILNVTPDSFSDGGVYEAIEQAISHCQTMLEQGATILDIGGESTRPGASRVDEAEQIKRTQPVIQRLAEVCPQAILSIDTTHSAVAKAALEAGAHLINDVSAGEEDPAILTLAAQHNAPIVLMHKQGNPATMQDAPTYQDVVAEVKTYLLGRAEVAMQAGVPKNQIILDPGIGFGKTTAHNLALLQELDQLVDTGYPILLGASRKRFLGHACTLDGKTPQPNDCVGATCATTAMGVTAGVHLFRVHDVQANRQAADVTWAIQHGLLG